MARAAARQALTNTTTKTSRRKTMSITVQHGKDDITTHASATKWHVDDAERLHIIGTNGNIASYNRGYWANVQHDGSGSQQITAVATLRKNDPRDGQVALVFSADYNDERNKAWSKYTPGLSVNMTVIDSVAEKFEQRGRYLITFENQE